MTKNKTTGPRVPRSEPFNYETFENEAISRMHEGAGLIGEKGVLTGLIQRLVNAALVGEVKSHLQAERLAGGELPGGLNAVTWESRAGAGLYFYRVLVDGEVLGTGRVVKM